MDKKRYKIFLSLFTLIFLLILFDKFATKIKVYIIGERYLKVLPYLDTLEDRMRYATKFYSYGKSAIDFLYKKINYGTEDEKERALCLLGEVKFASPEREVISFLIWKLESEKDSELKEIIKWVVLRMLTEREFKKEIFERYLLSSAKLKKGDLEKLKIYTQDIGDEKIYNAYKFLNSENPEVIIRAIKLLREKKETPSRSILKRFINHPNDEIKIQSLITLISFGDLEYIPKCVELLKKYPKILFWEEDIRNILLKTIPESIVDYNINLSGSLEEIKHQLDKYLFLYKKLKLQGISKK